MSEVKTVARNTAVLTAAQAVVIACGIASMKLTTTGLGVEDYGLFGYANSFNTIICSFMDLGLAALATRELARDRSLAGKYLSNFLTIRLLLALVVLAAVLAAGTAGLLPGRGVYVVYVVALSVVFSMLTGIFTAVFQSFERMEYIAVQTGMTSVLTLLAAAAMVYFRLDVLGYAALFCLAYGAVLAFCLLACALRFTPPRPAFDAGFWRESIREAVPFGVTSIFGIIYYQFGTVYLQYRQSEAAVGIFRAPFNLFMTILFVPQVLTTALYPVMSRRFVSSQGSLRAVFDRFLKYITILALPMGVGTTILADKIIYTLTDARYADSIVVLQILIWGAVAIFMSNAFATLLNSSNRQRTAMGISFVCMAVNVALNVWLVPLYSSVGVAIATAATEIIMLVLLALACLLAGGAFSRDSFISMARAAAASVAMGAFLLYFRAESLALLVAGGAVAYFAVLCLLGAFDREDVEIVSSILRRGKAGEGHGRE